MEGKTEKSKIGQLLEKLQEESWQLELLISGFSIFLVSASWEPIRDFMISTSVLESEMTSGVPIMSIAMGILVGSWLFLIINLILHFFLRGLWISAIGLRYISDDIDFETLNFAPKFDRYLKRRISSFDDFIDSLLHCLSLVNQIMVDDSIYSDLSYHFYEHPNRKENGLLTLIDIENLNRGEHRVIVNKRRLSNTDSLYWDCFSDFPF